MLRRIALLGLALLLSACETMQVSHDYNPAVDFAQFRTWAWKDPAVQYQPNNPMLRSDLTEQRIVQAVSSQLDQRGLRPVAAGSKPDLLVQTWLIVANRQEQVVTNYGYGGPWGGPWGGYWGGPWEGYWGAPMYNETRSGLPGWYAADRSDRCQRRQAGVARQCRESRRQQPDPG